jgi:hypothetical protein
MVWVRCNRGIGSLLTLWAALGCSGAESKSHSKSNTGTAGLSAGGGDAGTTSAGTGGTTGGTTADTGGTMNGNAGATGDAGATAGRNTGATSGSTGMSGSAGVGNLPCVADGECSASLEGTHCVGGGCCPPQYTCMEGQWKNPVYPPCAAPSCPDTPPQAGDACPTCIIPEDGCIWDQCTSSGVAYAGRCQYDVWQVYELGCNPAACCTSDEDCPDRVCTNDTCITTSSTDGCWRDEDCASGEVCSGFSVCKCNSACTQVTRPGTCVPDDLGCCLSDDDCAKGSTCVAGVCKEEAWQRCWTYYECACSGPRVCPCGSSCPEPDEPGYCI